MKINHYGNTVLTWELCWKIGATLPLEAHGSQTPHKPSRLRVAFQAHHAEQRATPNECGIVF